MSHVAMHYVPGRPDCPSFTGLRAILGASTTAAGSGSISTWCRWLDHGSLDAL